MLKHPAWHPFLIAIFPVLFLLAHNSHTVSISEAVLPVLIVLIVTAMLLAVVHLWFRNIARSAILASFVLLLFFTSEQVVTLIGRHEFILTLIWIMIAIPVAVVLSRSSRTFANPNFVLNVVAVYLVVFQLGMIGYSSISRDGVKQLSSIEASNINGIDYLPDIYYIICDGYGRADVLENLFNYDNSDFVNFLRQEGFYVADSSHANYGQTLLSLMSSLNIDYLFDLSQSLSESYTHRLLLAKRLHNNRVFDYLNAIGYSTVALSTGYKLSEIRSADYFVEADMGFSEFQNILLNITPIPRLAKRFLSQYDLHRGRNDFILDHLVTIQGRHSPQFVFVHVMLPHPPFIYGSNGEPVAPDYRFGFEDGNHFYDLGNSTEDYTDGYLNNLSYLNRSLKKQLSTILTESDPDPIIIIQGDHGPGSRLNHDHLDSTNAYERFSIMNAYYFPDSNYSMLYPSISPVNSFRIILNQFLGTDLELLEDRSYYSTWRNPLKFYDVTDKIARDREQNILPDQLDSLESSD